jgi:hypothetical protein
VILDKAKRRAISTGQRDAVQVERNLG